MVRSAVGSYLGAIQSLAMVQGINGATDRAQPLHVPYEEQPNSLTRLVVRCAVGNYPGAIQSLAMVQGINGDTDRDQPLHVPYEEQPNSLTCALHQRSLVFISGLVWGCISESFASIGFGQLPEPISKSRCEHPRWASPDPVALGCAWNIHPSLGA